LEAINKDYKIKGEGNLKNKKQQKLLLKTLIRGDII